MDKLLLDEIKNLDFSGLTINQLIIISHRLGYLAGVAIGQSRSVDYHAAERLYKNIVAEFERRCK